MARNTNTDERSDDFLDYPKTLGMASYYGLDYEVALCSLLFIRGINKCANKELNEFYLANNHADAGMFDDIVFVYSSNNNYKAILVQVKHKNSFKVNYDTLRGFFYKGSKQRQIKDFRLLNYCDSHKDISGRWKNFQAGDKFEVPIVQALFLIYTNAPLEIESETSDEEELLQIVTTKGDSHKFLYRNVSGALPAVDKSDGERFLSEFRFLANQPDYSALWTYIEQEVQTALLTSTGETRTVLESLRNKIKLWRDETHYSRYLSKNSSVWLNLMKERIKYFNGHIMIEDNNYFLKYRIPLVDLRDIIITSKKPVALIAKDRMTKAVLWKVYQALDDDNVLVVSEQTLVWRLEELLRLWTKQLCHVLIVEAESDLNEDLFLELQDVLNSDNRKHLVFVTYEVYNKQRWNVKTVDVSWSDFDQDSLDHLLDVYVQRYEPTKD